jgi:hypothetical protein
LSPVRVCRWRALSNSESETVRSDNPDYRDRRLGIYTLLVSTLPDFEHLQIIGEYPRTPLGQYLSLIGRRQLGEQKIPLTGPQEGFLQRLAALYQLYAGWRGGWMADAGPEQIHARAIACSII